MHMYCIRIRLGLQFFWGGGHVPLCPPVFYAYADALVLVAPAACWITTANTFERVPTLTVTVSADERGVDW